MYQLIPVYYPRSYLFLLLLCFGEYTNLHLSEFWLTVSIVVGFGSSIFNCYRFFYPELPVFISFSFSTQLSFKLWLIISAISLRSNASYH